MSQGGSPRVNVSWDHVGFGVMKQLAPLAFAGLVLAACQPPAQARRRHTGRARC